MKTKPFLRVVIPMLFAISCNQKDAKTNNRSEVQDLMAKVEKTVTADSASSAGKPDADYNTEEYGNIVENDFLAAKENPLSTFSIDVDHAAYSNIRRFIREGSLPPNGAVRIEEMVNYFDYDYTPPQNDDPFAVHTEISSCPWNEKHRLVHIGLKGKEIAKDKLPPANLVFLIDVSGSMDEPNKLPLVKSSLNMLTDQLREEDKVAIVVYAGAAGMVLPSTHGNEKMKIKDAINNLDAGGATAGAEGIRLAYEIARQNFISNGNNRVVLATDGDFNVGVSSDDELVSLIEKQRKTNIFLTALGFGMGNYKDSKMQQLADKGNGNHAYIDNESEATKELVKEFGGTLFTIAKDVKLQVEFNPAKVQSYRLIGYENRMLKKEDFNNDAKDAGELGAGHRVTALYEVIPVGVKDEPITKVDPLKYQAQLTNNYSNSTNEIMTIKLRFKKPDEEISKLIVHPVVDTHTALLSTSDNFRFSAAVAAFGMVLRNSAYKANASYKSVIELAESASGRDKEGYRNEFIELVNEAARLTKKGESKNF